MNHINSSTLSWPLSSMSGSSVAITHEPYKKDNRDVSINIGENVHLVDQLNYHHHHQQQQQQQQRQQQAHPSHNTSFGERSDSQLMDIEDLSATNVFATFSPQQGLQSSFQNIPHMNSFHANGTTSSSSHPLDHNQAIADNTTNVAQSTITLQTLPRPDHSNQIKQDSLRPADPRKRSKKKNANSKREQYRSCDQCRSAKSACDLKLEAPLVDGIPAKACSGCARREIFCTALWLEKMLVQREEKKKKMSSKQQSQQQTRQSIPALHPIETNLTPSNIIPANGIEDFLTPITAPSAHLVPNATIENTQPPLWQHLYALQTYNSHTLPHTKLEQRLGKDAMINNLERNKFKIFYETFEIPFSHWLGQDCIPPPYRAGLAIMNDRANKAKANSQLNSNKSSADINSHRGNEALQRILNQAMLETGLDAIGKCSFASAPFLLSSVYILDALMDSKRFRGSRNPRAAAYNAQIESALHSAVLASASQYGSQNAQTLEAQRHMTATAWYKAKKELFDLISDTWSFRLALGLLIFGMTTPPTPEDGHVDQPTSELYQNTLFAATEACQRLRHLCQYVHRIISRCRKQQRSAAVDSDILELLGALEWLAIMIDTVKTVTFRTNVSNPLTNAAISSSDANEEQMDLFEDSLGSSMIGEEMINLMPAGEVDDNDENEDIDHSYSNAEEDNILLLSRLDLNPESSGESNSSQVTSRAHKTNVARSSSIQDSLSNTQPVPFSRWQDVKMWNLIIERTRQTSRQARVQITQSGTIDTELLLLTIRRASSLKILLWKAVADYANLSRCEKHINKLLKISEGKMFGHNVVEQDEAYQTVVEIIRLWHSIFGEMTKNAIGSFASLPKSARSMLSFVCNHVALGTLHFFNIAESIQRDLDSREKKKNKRSPNANVSSIQGSSVFGQDRINTDRIEQRDTKYKFSSQHQTLRLNAAEHISLIAELNNAYAHQNVEFPIVNMVAGEVKVTEAVLSASSNAYHPDFWQHPFISMFLQAQHMAAYELLQEAQAAVSLQATYNGRPISFLLRSADVCIIAIQRMLSGLISVPKPAIESKMQLEVLQAMRASFGF